MGSQVLKAAQMLEVLPEAEQDFAIEVLKKLVLAWDPDWTRLTAAEKSRLDEAEKEFFSGEVVEESAELWS